MAMDLDIRVDTYERPFDLDKIEQAIRKNFPENQIVEIRGVNSFLGSAQQVRSRYIGRDTATPPKEKLSDKDLVDRAQQYLTWVAPALGFDAQARLEFVPDPFIKTTLTGERVINLQQHYRGIPV